MKSNRNVYFNARKDAQRYNEKLTREGAAEMIGVSVSSLADYELGNTKVVPVDKVVLMADLYNCPELKTGYCKHECPIGKDYPVATKRGNLEGAALRLIHELHDTEKQQIAEKIMKIAMDGVVSGNERPELEMILRKLEDMTTAISELLLIGRKEMRET